MLHPTPYPAPSRGGVFSLPLQHYFGIRTPASACADCNAICGSIRLIRSLEPIEIEVDGKPKFGQSNDNIPLEMEAGITFPKVSNQLHPALVFDSQCFKAAFPCIQLRQDIFDVVF